MTAVKDQGLSPAVRALLECWDELLLAVWLDAQLEDRWQWHTTSGAAWPAPDGLPS